LAPPATVNPRFPALPLVSGELFTADSTASRVTAIHVNEADLDDEKSGGTSMGIIILDIFACEKDQL
jgi:hypothetical protein